MTPRQDGVHHPSPQLKPDEAELVAKYRNATPAGKAVMRRLALRYRNTHPAVSNIKDQTPCS